MKKLLYKLVGLRLNLLSYINPGKAGKIAFHLFCFPYRPKLKPHQLEFLESGHHDTLVVGTDSVQVYKWGSGKRKVLFVHGWSSHSFRWKKYVKALVEEGFSVYALDAPGHGRSTGKFLNLVYYSEVIEGFINQLGGVDFLVAHSIGGFASLYALHRVPELPVRSLIIMGTPGEAKEFVGSYQSTLGVSSRVVRLMKEYFIKSIGQSPEYFSASFFASTLKIPGMIIHDEQDVEAPIKYAYQINQAWSGSQLHITKGFGHNLRSGEVVHVLRDYIMANADHGPKREANSTRGVEV